MESTRIILGIIWGLYVVFASVSLALALILLNCSVFASKP